MHLKTRVARIALSIPALAVGAAIALPGAAIAADSPSGLGVRMNQSQLTANGDATQTDITLTLPAGTALCFGPIVLEGIVTEDQALADPDLLAGSIYPVHFEYQGVGTRQAINSPLGQMYDIKGASLTVTIPLGAGEFSAAMMCMTNNQLRDFPDGGGTLYLRHIKDGQGEGGNNTPPSLGSLGDLLGGLSTGS